MVAQVDGAAQIGQARAHDNLTSRLPWVEVEGMAWKAMAQGQGMVEECGCQLMEGDGSPGWVVTTQNRRTHAQKVVKLIKLDKRCVCHLKIMVGQQ